MEYLTKPDWRIEGAARAMNKSPEEVRRELEQYDIESFKTDVSEELIFAAPAGEDPWRCFNVGLVATMALRLCAQAKVGGSDWQVGIRGELVVATVPVKTIETVLNKDNLSTTHSFETFLTRVSLTVGMRNQYPDRPNPGLCLFIGGRAGVWLGEWKDATFDQNLFCIDR